MTTTIESPLLQGVVQAFLQIDESLTIRTVAEGSYTTDAILTLPDKSRLDIDLSGFVVNVRVLVPITVRDQRKDIGCFPYRVDLRNPTSIQQLQSWWSRTKEEITPKQKNLEVFWNDETRSHWLNA